MTHELRSRYTVEIIDDMGLGSLKRRAIGSPGKMFVIRFCRLMTFFKNSSNVGLLLHDQSAPLDEFLDALPNVSWHLAVNIVI